ncbi:uncharacterized protein DSM5745_07494 [Aspergillus mulundensis]|uniref:Uncharacterized protein n=1 Tax=Aspergillus mulundensis TaxID=1810919 RepID=A0A3D8RE69_9EURO|nr:Uncharacterized protein DSM5745_07494 [Aspergillus mulundensis]RDW72322.1 Uncharacterized protein DSM5745_07494 [Aspergillus mulundensis]
MLKGYLLFLLTLLISLSSAMGSGFKRSWAVLESDNIQTASQQDGLPSNNSVGYVPSATDPANFINYCTRRVLTNGQFSSQSSCNGIVMGDIPSDKNMVSTIITYPLPGQTVLAHKTFPINFRTLNLATGSVTNPNSTLYSAPQSLQGGNIVGHVHVTIQSLFDFRNDQLEGYGVPPDPANFVFFKTVFGEENAQNGYSVPVADGLPIGFYRVCTMAATSNHQPVVMPVVERGAQDDCQKFEVI